MSGTRVPGFDARMSFVCPATLVERVAEAARIEMTSSGAWLRAAALDRLKSKERARRAITDMKAP
jgi:hypothetical protein